MATKKKTTMAELFGSGKSLSIQQLSRGDVVEGTIIDINDNGALVDVGAKSEGVIPLAESKSSQVKIGEKVFVYVLTPEDKRGQLLLSLNRAATVKTWVDLENAYKEGKTVDVVVTGHNKGGLVAEMNGLSGFIPFSHTESASDLSGEKAEIQGVLDKLVGQTLKVRIIELDREENRIILSEKEASIGAAVEKRREGISTLKVGEIVTGNVSAVMPYGLMVDLGGFEGLIPQDEITWDAAAVEESLANFETGQEISAQILEIDADLGKVKLSLKNVTHDPWKALEEKHKAGDVVEANVTRLTSYGVFASVEGQVEGLISISTIPPEQELKVGQTISVLIDVLDTDKRRLDLSFKSA